MKSHGTVYLIHFDRPFGHARHYLGFARNLDSRIAEHNSGVGARLLFHVRNAGIGFRVVRTWPGGRDMERRLKRRGGHCRLCPICLETVTTNSRPRKRGMTR